MLRLFINHVQGTFNLWPFSAYCLKVQPMSYWDYTFYGYTGQLLTLKIEQKGEIETLHSV